MILPVIFMSFCQEKPELVISKSFAQVDPELWELFTLFEEEGKKRGMVIDLQAERISGGIRDLGPQGRTGLCNHRAQEPNQVVIDRHFWRTASDDLKELVVFHELGHCYLSRQHRDDAFPDGRCKSIMRSGGGACIDLYNTSTREDYLDELYK